MPPITISATVIVAAHDADAFAIASHYFRDTPCHCHAGDMPPLPLDFSFFFCRHAAADIIATLLPYFYCFGFSPLPLLRRHCRFSADAALPFFDAAIC